MKSVVAHLACMVIIIWYRICRLFPKQQRIVLMSRQNDGTTTDFDLICQHIRINCPGWETVVLAKKLANPLRYIPHVLRQTYHIATARAAILDSYCISVSMLNKRIKIPVLQMWHALGNMKKFGYMILDTPEGRSSRTAHLMHMHEGYDSVLVSSLNFAEDLAAGFNVDSSLLYEAPLPRTDMLVNPDIRLQKKREALSAIPELGNGKENIVYCPTWRRASAPNEAEAMQALIDAIDFKRYNLVFKRHPVSTQHMDDSRVIQDFDPQVDVLYAADYIISDYSTIIYEAGLLEKPLYIYAYDWETYSGKRSLNIDMQQDVPALFTANPAEIVDAIERNDFDSAAYMEFIRANVTLPERETCTQRIVKHVFKLMDASDNIPAHPGSAGS